MSAETNETQDLRALLGKLDARLTRIEDVDAIRRLIVTYARGCDRGNDPGIIGPCFAADGVWECKGFGRYQGRETLAQALRGISGEKIWWSLHYMISPFIDIAPDGKTATAFWYLWESATVPDPHTDEAEPHWIGGTYDCHCVKRDGQWLFQSMELKLNMVSPCQEGWVKAKFLDGSANSPYLMNLEPGPYYWCSCGLSRRQPFCDGAHKKEGQYKPLVFELKDHSHVALCGCKHSKTKPWCDGSHLKLNQPASGPDAA